MHHDSITLKQLRALVAVADAGSVTAAAERLHVTAPAVSIQLRTLEDNVGGPVLSRPDLMPNAIGRELLDAARRIEMQLSRAMGRVEALRAGRAGRVVLGVTSTGKYFAPGLIARISKAMPELDVPLVIGNRSEIIAGLADGWLDLAITGRPPREPVVDAAVIGDHPHVWIAPPDHRLVAVRKLAASDLLRETILTREDGSGTRILMERLIDREGEGRPFRRMEFNSNETIKQAVMAGLGIAFISGHTVVAEIENGRLALLDVNGAPVIRRWFVLSLGAEPTSGAVRRVLDFILGEAGDFLPRCSSGWRREWAAPAVAAVPALADRR